MRHFRISVREGSARKADRASGTERERVGIAAENPFEIDV
jgi:hypothetical protein